MRATLVAHDLIECILGLGPNLFYNSPMEACVVVCRMQKPPERRGRILFINAVHEVTRERAQSFLEEEHIQKIVRAYQEFHDRTHFARVVPLEVIHAQQDNLNIALYVRPATGGTGSTPADAPPALAEAITAWEQSSLDLRTAMADLFATLNGQDEQTETVL